MTELLDLNYHTLMDIYKKNSLMIGEITSPIVENLIEQINEGISTGKVYNVYKKQEGNMNWWSSKKFYYGKIEFVLTYDKLPEHADWQYVSRKLKKIVSERYENSHVTAHAFRKNGNIITLNIYMREDGKPFPDGFFGPYD